MGDDFFIIGFRRRRRSQEAGSLLPPGADDSRQAGDEARRHGAVAIAGLAAAEADERRPGPAVGVGQFDDDVGRHAGDALRFFRRILGQDVLFQVLPAEDVPVQEGFVSQAVTVEDMHHAQGQGSIRTGADGDEVVGQVGRLVAIGIDTPDDGPFGPGRFDVVVEVDIRGQHMDAPEEDAVAVLGCLRRRRHGIAHDVLEAPPFGRSADGPVQFRSTQTIEQAVQGVVLDDAHGTGIRIGQDGFGTGFGDDGLPGPGYFCQGLVPGNGRELAASLGANPLQRRRQAARRMDGPLIMGHLRAQRPARKGMGLVAGNGYDAAAVDRHDEPAGIGAVIRTDRCTGFHGITSCFVEKRSCRIATAPFKQLAVRG